MGPAPTRENPDLPTRTISEVLLSSSFQAAAGPWSSALIVLGYAALRLGTWAGVPRVEIVTMLCIALGAALASMAVTLGAVLLMARQTESKTRASLSIACGILTFVLAAPLFWLTFGAVYSSPVSR